MENCDLKSALLNLKSGDAISQFKGFDEKGAPKEDYLIKLIRLSSKELYEESKKNIHRWVKMRKNTKKDYFWKMNACYAECLRREKPQIFHRAHEKEYNNHIYEKNE